MKQYRTIIAVATAGTLLIALFVGVLLTSAPQDGPPPALLLANPDLTYDPVSAGEQMPAGYRQLLARDQIAPIYNPEFTTPSEVDWPDQMLVIGVAGANTSKVYPITPLNQREMVIDSLEGIPILVTW